MIPATRATDDPPCIAVIGAGAAGVAAASAAERSARRPVRVVVIEASNRLGGAVTSAMHRSMCGLYASQPKNPLDTLNAFSQRDLVRRMLHKDPQGVIARSFGRAPVLEFPRPAWESSLAEMLSDSKAELIVNCRLLKVRRDGNFLTAMKIASPAGGPQNRWIEVNALIDCTGAGHVLRMAGDDAFQPSDGPSSHMLGGFAIRLTGLTGDPEMHRLQIVYSLTSAVEKGLLPPLARFTAFYPGPGEGEGIFKLAINVDESGPDDALAFAQKIFACLKQETPGFSAATIAETSPRIIPRDGFRLRGRYTITEDDILQARKHGPDAVHAWWPMERWDISRGPTYVYPPAGDHYDIPPQALHSAAIDNLFAAGTCISATLGAAASTRASGICLATGDAAGRLAISEFNY